MSILSYIRLIVPGSLLTISAVFIFLEKFDKPPSDEIHLSINATELGVPKFSVNTSLEKYFLVFAIPSDPHHVELRRTIRKTWSNITSWGNSLSRIDDWHKRFKLMFIFGSEHEFNQNFENELKMHGDDMFIIDGLEDNYSTLKDKVLWAMTKALHSYDFTYFIKTDDDIVVNLPKLLADSRKLPTDHYYAGNCYRYYKHRNSDYENW